MPPIHPKRWPIAVGNGAARERWPNRKLPPWRRPRPTGRWSRAVRKPAQAGLQHPLPGGRAGRVLGAGMKGAPAHVRPRCQATDRQVVGETAPRPIKQRGQRVSVRRHRPLDEAAPGRRRGTARSRSAARDPAGETGIFTIYPPPLTVPLDAKGHGNRCFRGVAPLVRLMFAAT
jgi:hypothetical protein